MAKVSKVVFSALVALFLASANLGAQSGGSRSTGALAGTALPGNLTVPAAPAKKGTIARQKAAGAARKTQICFQPGVGWQMLTAPSAGSSGMAYGDQSVHSPGQSQSTTSRVTKPAFSRPSGSARAAEETCSAVLPLPPANGAIPTNVPGLVNPGGSSLTEIENGTAGGSTYGTSTPGFGSATSGSTLGGASPAPGQGSFGAMPLGEPQSTGMEGKTYISPIALRRLLRNTPDLETRIRVRRQLEGLRKEATHPIEPSKSDRTMKHPEKESTRSTKPRSTRNKESDRVTHP
jgi:hypothetical protein